MADDDDRNPVSETGYRKPPKHTQFVQGKSGNPKGRPKGSKNFATVIQSELKRRVAVTEDGKRKRITKREAVAKQLVNKAAAGDHKAIPVLLNETRPFETDAAIGATQSESLSPEDRAVMQNMLRRIHATASGSNPAGPALQPTTDLPETTPPYDEEGVPQ
jgi:hypothetical protein